MDTNKHKKYSMYYDFSALGYVLWCLYLLF